MFYSQETINGGEHSSQLSQIPSFAFTEAQKTQVYKHTHTQRHKYRHLLVRKGQAEGD